MTYAYRHEIPAMDGCAQSKLIGFGRVAEETGFFAAIAVGNTGATLLPGGSDADPAVLLLHGSPTLRLNAGVFQILEDSVDRLDLSISDAEFCSGQGDDCVAADGPVVVRVGGRVTPLDPSTAVVPHPHLIDAQSQLPLCVADGELR